MPDACIGVDVIVGFPGEDESAFMETYEFLQQLNISYLHVFTYSERPNTTAIRIADVVPLKERNERSKRLRILSAKKKRAFYESQVGRTYNVLFEAERDGDHMYGFTDNYIKVRAPYQEEMTNTIQLVGPLEMGREETMTGEILTSETINA